MYDLIHQAVESNIIFAIVLFLYFGLGYLLYWLDEDKNLDVNEVNE